jgi:hypothetical protein
MEETIKQISDEGYKIKNISGTDKLTKIESYSEKSFTKKRYDYLSKTGSATCFSYY